MDDRKEVPPNHPDGEYEGWVNLILGRDVEDEFYSLCVACGAPSDFCQGHGEIGDPAGHAILEAHDNGDHSQCVKAACDG